MVTSCSTESHSLSSWAMKHTCWRLPHILCSLGHRQTVDPIRILKIKPLKSYSELVTCKRAGQEVAADLSQQAKHGLRPVPSPVAKLEGKGTCVLRHSRPGICVVILAVSNPAFAN